MKTLPFYILLLMTFGLASFEKFHGAEVPAWFVTQFKDTPLNLFSGSLGLAFFGVALLEGATFLLIAIGLARKEFLSNGTKKYLSLGVILAQVTFISLGFGQRLTHQYDAAASLFFYAVLTFIAGQFALKAEG